MSLDLQWAAAFGFAIATPFLLALAGIGFVGGLGPLRGARLILATVLLLWLGALVVLLRWVSPYVMGGAMAAVLFWFGVRAGFDLWRERRAPPRDDPFGAPDPGAEEPPPSR